MFRRLTKQPIFFLQQFTNRTKTKPKSLEKDIPFVEKIIFISKSDDLIAMLDRAFQNQQNFEPRIEKIEQIFLQDQEIYELSVLITHLGEYKFTADYKLKLLYFQSPLNGIFKYYYDEQLQQWVSNKDDHFLIENMTREITKHCKGYLDL